MCQNSFFLLFRVLIRQIFREIFQIYDGLWLISLHSSPKETQLFWSCLVLKLWFNELWAKFHRPWSRVTMKNLEIKVAFVLGKSVFRPIPQKLDNKSLGGNPHRKRHSHVQMHGQNYGSFPLKILISLK